MTTEREQRITDIINRLQVDILEVVGDEFAPKKRVSTPERRRLLGLIPDMFPYRQEAEKALEALLVEVEREAKLQEHELLQHQGQNVVKSLNGLLGWSEERSKMLSTKDESELTSEYFRESNLIEGIDDPDEDEQLERAWNFLTTKTAVNRAVLFEVHEMVVQNQIELSDIQKGNYRHIQVYVGDHTPPNALRVPELMENWLKDWLEMTPKEAHIEFETIHPFVDGNGRVGRLLMWWHELKLGLEPTLIRSDKRQEYYDWFREAREG